MHNLAFAFMLFSSLLSAAADDEAPPPPRGIAWVKTFAEAKEASAASRKPLLIDFEAEWCGFCKKLDRETYADEQVIRHVSEVFIAVKVDTDQDPETAKKHKVRALPTIVVISPGGEEIHRMEGFRPPDLFLKEIRGSADAARSLERMKELAEKDPKDAAAQRAYARALFASGNHEGAVRVLSAAIEVVPAASPERAGLYLDLGDAWWAGGKGAEARGAYEKALAIGAEGARDERRKASVALARVLVSLRETDAAIRVLDGFLGGEAERGGDRLEALFLRGYAHAVRKDAEKAIEDLKTARAEDPDGRWGTRAGFILDLVETK